MTNRAGLSLILPLIWLLFIPAIARGADEPVASAPIPPPLPAPYVVPSTPPHPAAAPPHPASTPAANSPITKAPGAAMTPAKPLSTEVAKKSEPAAARKSSEHKTAAAHRPSRHRKVEARRLVAHASPPRALQRPRYYAGGTMPGPEVDGPPPFPPPWYDRGRPLAGYPYGPRGPLPPW
jgi:hypothetical protein